RLSFCACTSLLHSRLGAKPAASFRASRESTTDAHMRTCWFIVIKSRGSWWIDREGKAYGPIDDVEEAVNYACKIAETYGDPERQSEVWVPGPAGRHVLHWRGAAPNRRRAA